MGEPVIFDATPDTAYVNHFSRENLLLVLRFCPHLAKDLLEINICTCFQRDSVFRFGDREGRHVR